VKCPSPPRREEMIEIILKIDEEEKRWEIQNPKVEDILRKIPVNKIPEYVEMYILVGDTVLNYATIQTSEETLERYFGNIIQGLTEQVNEIAKLKEKVEKEISENLPGVIKEKIENEIRGKLIELKGQIEALKHIKDNLPDTVKAQLGECIGKLEEAIKNVKTSSDTLSQFIGIYRGTKERGEIGEEFVYTTLVDNFKEDSFEDVSAQGNYSDIKAQSPDMVDVLIEVKNYKNPVPTSQVQKFWKDLEARNINIGCFISLGTRIQGGVGDYKIMTNGNKLGIFMNVGQFIGQNGMEDGVKLAYFIAKKFAQYYRQVERERIEEGALRQKIESIFTEMTYLKSQLEKLKEIRDKIRKIKETAQESVTSIDELYEEFTHRIEKIMTDKEES